MTRSLLILLVLFGSCTSRPSQEEPDTKSLDLMNRAIDVQMESPQRALQMLDSALEISGSYLAWEQKGQIYIQLGQFDSAAYCLEQSLEEFPENSETLLMLGAVHHRNSDPAASESAWRKSLELYTEKGDLGLFHRYLNLRLLNEDEQVKELQSEIDPIQNEQISGLQMLSREELINRVLPAHQHHH